jgi:hypothetical protein
MAEFLVEVYVAHHDHDAAREIRHAAQTAAAPSAAQRTARCLGSILVPEDETCFLLYEAPSAAAVADDVRRAGLRPEHIAAAVSRPSPLGEVRRTSTTQRKEPA